MLFQNNSHINKKKNLKWNLCYSNPSKLKSQKGRKGTCKINTLLFEHVIFILKLNSWINSIIFFLPCSKLHIENKPIQTITDPMENYPNYNKMCSFSTNYYLTEYFYVQILNTHCPRNWRYKEIKNPKALVSGNGMRKTNMYIVCVMISSMKNLKT